MRESFVIHSEYIEDLPKDYKTKFLLYVYNFGIHGVVPKCEGLELALWKKIQRRIEGDAAQYRISLLQNRIKTIQYRIKNDKATDTDKENLVKYNEELKNLVTVQKVTRSNETDKNLSNGLNGSETSKTVLPYTRGVSDSVSDNDIDNEYVSDIDNVSDNDNETVVVVGGEKKTTTTTTPTFEEVQNFIDEKNLNVNAEDFFNYYSNENWRIKSWKNAAIGWDKREKNDVRNSSDIKFWEKN